MTPIEAMLETPGVAGESQSEYSPELTGEELSAEERYRVVTDYVNEFHQDVYRFAYRLTGEADWAEDIVSFSGDSKASIWLEEIKKKFHDVASVAVAKMGWKALFERYDKDGSGEIDSVEFRTAARRDCQIPERDISDAELEQLFKEVDADGSGDVTIARIAGSSCATSTSAAPAASTGYHTTTVPGGSSTSQVPGSIQAAEVATGRRFPSSKTVAVSAVGR